MGKDDDFLIIFGGFDACLFEKFDLMLVGNRTVHEQIAGVVIGTVETDD